MNTFRFSNRRAALAAMTITLAAPLASLAQGSNFPERPVRLVVGSAAGTGPDVLARLFAQQLSQQLGGASVVVENKTGAAGLLAAQEVARATPDGHTLLMAQAGVLSIAPHTYDKLPYDPARDFVPVSLIADSEFVLLVNPQKVPARTPADFVKWAQQQDRVFFGTFGAGTVGHFGAYILADAFKVRPDVVHYRNTSDALGGLYNGDVVGEFASIGLAAPQVKSGKLVALGSSGRERSRSLPDVPTFREAGYPDITFGAWTGLVAPARTPAAIVSRLEQAAQKATKAAEDRIEQAGFLPIGSTAESFARTIRADTEMWGKAARATGFKADAR
ncbi:tripartite tricarboxylate transporter substrate binding protein [Ramlibacter sp. AW1]|uniref:Tripartite tricarboxylate transporter substrate binding protein n=1 Tax=Ramlibacter aurantiacus TaxID=2801330 RepID=A0A936ZJZ7_9BURK|nr:tripartite tricarboxylate transporter substrate binding protein [Ramlibacter aurantiacus]MBL0419131.1 tripartite tricarboxylate transporter substrate binding protein [Ramlibacter aurantiacus]